MSSDYIDGDAETQKGGLYQETVIFRSSGNTSNEITGPSLNPANEIPRIITKRGNQDLPIVNTAGSSRRLSTQGQGQKRKRMGERAEHPADDPFVISNDIGKQKLLILENTLDEKMEKKTKF